MAQAGDSIFSENERPSVSWGAIFAGALLALAFQIVFMSLGSAIGFTSYDPGKGDSLSQGSMIGAAVYTIITSLISLFAGGFVAARLAGFKVRSVSGFHGLCSWALVSLFSLMMVAMGVGKVVGAAFGIVGSGVSGVAQAGASAVQSAGISGQDVSNEVKKTLRQTGKTELQPEQLKQDVQSAPHDAAKDQANGSQGFQNQVDDKKQALDRDAMTNVLSKRLNISKQEANRLLDQGQQKAGEIGNQVKAQAAQAAQTGTRVAAGVSWTAFFALLLGGLAAFFGGLTGNPLASSRRQARHLQRAA